MKSNNNMYISKINIFPIKSLGGISLENAIVEDRGLQYDRRYLLVDEDGKFLTQREYSKMALIDVSINKDYLEVGIKGFETLRISKEFENAEKTNVQIWSSFCDALIADEKTNQWFSEVLNFNCRLVQMPVSTHRQINETFNKGNEVVSFADGYPILIISESSLADLNSKLESSIPMNRFRPNIVVSDAEAFAEDSWKKIKIGNTVFRSTKPCARCVVTTIDQETGVSDVKEPLKTLATYRKSFDVFPDSFEHFGLVKNDVLFGQNLVAENFGEGIKTGDKIEVLEV